jgi:hypothetical protein
MSEHDCDFFVCRDCGRDVYSFPQQNPPPKPVCGACLFLNEFVDDPVEREKLRKQMTGSAVQRAAA